MSVSGDDFGGFELARIQSILNGQKTAVLFPRSDLCVSVLRKTCAKRRLAEGCKTAKIGIIAKTATDRYCRLVWVGSAEFNLALTLDSVPRCDPLETFMRRVLEHGHTSYRDRLLRGGSRS